MSELPDFGAAPRRENASVAAAGVLRKAIIDGRFAPGQRLKESELADALGFSRTPIREALLILQSDGMIFNEPRKGAIVRAYTDVELEDMFELRAQLEVFAARRACHRRTDDDLAELEDTANRLEKIDVTGATVGEIWHENVRFHMGVAVAAHTAKLVGFLRSLFDLPVYYMRPSDYTAEQKATFARAHRLIVEAIWARDVSSADILMRAHVLEARSVRVEHDNDTVTVGEKAARQRSAQTSR
jgi:DNA-binding GntR family transcriptional regulator